MTPLERSDAAKQLLSNPVFKAALHDIREGLVRGLESAQMSDVDTHHEAALSLQLLKRLQTQLQRYIDDAKIEKRKAEQDSWLNRARQSVAQLR